MHARDSTGAGTSAHHVRQKGADYVTILFALPPSAAPAEEDNRSFQKTKGKSRLSKKEINGQGHAACCNKTQHNAYPSIADDLVPSWMTHFLCVQAGQGKQVSVFVKNAKEDEFGLSIGHGGRFWTPGRRIVTGWQPFLFFPTYAWRSGATSS